ncbi:MAG: bifunctional chorismate mutase/prephenate dehydratase, partial [Candidatus Hydromicrobium americanum]
ENIEDNASNSTRFLVIAKDKSSTGNKCSIAFKTAHKAGALFRVLRIFSEANINLTRIESRPIRNDPGNYAFLLDFEGSDKDNKIINALEKVKDETVMLNILGCYK